MENLLYSLLETVLKEERESLDALLCQQSKLEMEIKHIQERIAAAEVLLGKKANLDVKTQKKEDKQKAPQPKNGGIKVADVAYRLIKKKGGPISVQELWEQLQLVGRPVKRDGIPTTLTRDGRFIKIGRGLYNLAT